jgi:AcrR family transcriptional regulator
MTTKQVGRANSEKSLADQKTVVRVGRPRGSNKEAKLAKILGVARRQFAEKGFSQTTFKDIGHEAGMTHAALYSYFASKIELYVATLVDTQGVLLPEYLRAIEEGKTLRERFRRILMASAAAADRDATVTGFLAAVPMEVRRHPELLDEVRKQDKNGIYQALINMFEVAKRNGELNPELSTENLVSAFFGGALGVSLFHYGMHSTRLTDAMSIFATLIDCGFDTPGIGFSASGAKGADMSLEKQPASSGWRKTVTVSS